MVISISYLALVTMSDIHEHVPPRSSGQCVGALLSVGIAPMEALVRVPVAAPSMVMVSGSFCPFFMKAGWLVLVSAVGILVTVVATML